MMIHPSFSRLTPEREKEIREFSEKNASYLAEYMRQLLEEIDALRAENEKLSKFYDEHAGQALEAYDEDERKDRDALVAALDDARSTRLAIKLVRAEQERDAALTKSKYFHDSILDAARELDDIYDDLAIGRCTLKGNEFKAVFVIRDKLFEALHKTDDAADGG